jgi:Protein of unknown function (DUF2628)
VKTFLVFEPQAGSRTPEEAERVVFLREKFSWPALVFGPLWLLWYRLWLGLAFWLAAMALIGAAVAALRLESFIAALALSVPSLILAFEATLLRQQRLAADGFRDAGVVLAEDIESAERHFFDRWLTREKGKPQSPSSLPPLPQPSQSPVIGFFPDSGAIR